MEHCRRGPRYIHQRDETLGRLPSDFHHFHKFTKVHLEIGSVCWNFTHCVAPICDSSRHLTTLPFILDKDSHNSLISVNPTSEIEKPPARQTVHIFNSVNRAEITLQ